MKVIALYKNLKLVKSGKNYLVVHKYNPSATALYLDACETGQLKDGLDIYHIPQDEKDWLKHPDVTKRLTP